VEIDFNSELDLEAFVADIESDASQQVYTQRHIHPLVCLAGTHDSDPAPMDPQGLPPLEGELRPSVDASEY
jgi:hypothetical protein